MLFRSHDYSGDDDYARMRSLLQRAYALAGPDVGMTVGDLDYWRFQAPDPDADIRSCRLWTGDGGRTLGFAWPGVVEDDDGVIDLFAHPRHPELIEPMLAWAEDWHAERRAGGAVIVDGRGSDDRLTAVLTRRGYERTGSFSHWYRVRPLNAPMPEPALDAGYALRPADARDAAAVASTNNAAGAGPTLTEASCLALMAAPTYRSDLHIVATEVGGSAIAAFCLVWFDEVNPVGLFEPVACAPAHRRRGLARAVMTEGLRRLQRLGAEHALVATGGENAPANRLYESLGFVARGKSWRWRLRATGAHTPWHPLNRGPTP